VGPQATLMPRNQGGSKWIRTEFALISTIWDPGELTERLWPPLYTSHAPSGTGHEPSPPPRDPRPGSPPRPALASVMTGAS